jgi:hypothetical protein
MAKFGYKLKVELAYWPIAGSMEGWEQTVDSLNSHLSFWTVRHKIWYVDLK